MTAAERQWRMQKEEFREYAREILDLLPESAGGKLLDVGCGLGWVVAEAQKRGWAARGIDSSRDFTETGRKRLGVDLRNVSLERFRAREKYQVIILKHILEHIARPGLFLARIKRLITPGGYLLVACPNAASLAARVFGERWYGWQKKEHRQQFTPETLTALIRRHGFATEKIVINNLGYHVLGIKGLLFKVFLSAVRFLQLGDQVIILARPSISI